MPLNDIDVVRRRFSIGLPIDQVDLILYSYNEQRSEERYFHSTLELINVLKQDHHNENSYWIEVRNRSRVNLPDNIQLLCEYLDIHPLTIEDITTLAPSMKIDFFPNQFALYLLLKITSWNGQRVEQQQISFYLKYTRNILVTFQENAVDDDQSFFDSIRQHFRSNVSSRFRQLNIDYLFYCLFNAIIDRSLLVIDQIAQRIDQFDEQLMADRYSFTLKTCHSIYRLKHDLLHLRILFNPLKEILSRLRRTTENKQLIFLHQMTTIARWNCHSRRPIRTSRSLAILPSCEQSRRTSVFVNETNYLYLNDLNDHIIQLVDSVEIQRENISNLLSFAMNFDRNQTQKTLEILMLISVLFMPCLLLSGMNSTNFDIQPQYQYQYGYFIIVILSVVILMGMIVWYRLKRWI